MRLTTGQTLKRCMILVAGAMVGLVAFAGAAQAAVTTAPNIVSTPSDPQTTSVRSEFKFTVGTGETSTASPLRFYCRDYPTGTTPSIWRPCGLSTDLQPSSYVKTGIANGNTTFDVVAQETTSPSTQGPIATYSWTQNIPAPSAPPVLTETPDNPMHSYPTNIRFEPADVDSELVDRYQCRIDVASGGDWSTCTSAATSLTLPNGDHTFEVRAGNTAGYGPSTVVEWTSDVPNPKTNVRLSQNYLTRYVGAAANDSIGDVTSGAASSAGPMGIGDQNDDGLDDILIGTKTGQTGASAGVFVVYGSRTGFGTKSLASISPSEGFRIKPVGAGGTNVRAYRRIADQNGDGIEDILLGAGFDGVPFSPIFKSYVIYGGIDASALPLCPGSTVTTCLDLATLNDDQGYELHSSTTVRMTEQGIMDSVGDFDGDGIADFALGSKQGGGSVYVVKGGVRTGSTDVTTLPTSEVFQVTGVANTGFASGVTSVGDMNGDGKGDIFVDSNSSPGGGYILFGRPFGSTLNITDFSQDDGIWLAAPSLTILAPRSIGDINGDGRGDLSVGPRQSVGDQIDGFSILYGPETPTADPLISGLDLIPGTGYLVEADGMSLGLGGETRPGGDLNNDGVPDVLAAAPTAHVDGMARVGAGFLVFGSANPPVDGSIKIGENLDPSVGVAMIGSAQDDRSGTSVSSLGDTDGDGLDDYAIGAPGVDESGLSNVGAVYIVPGSSLINQVKTQSALGVGNESAILNAGLSTNNRDSQVWFEYGTTADYGSSTEPESFEASNAGDAASASIDGLTKNTEYHYRAVAKNALGLVRYGDDQTFTTTNVTPPDGPSPCLKDPTLPGCDKYDPCQADNTKPGCSGYCAANPDKCSTTGPAKLALISTTKKIQVKRGKAGVLAVAVVNTGGKAASGVKVCVKAPKRLVKVKKCVKVGKLGSGKSRIVKVRVKVKPKAKRGKKAVLKLTASGNKLSAKKAKATVVVR